MKQNEKMKNDFIKELQGYFMQLAYVKDLINVSNDIDKHKNKLEVAPVFTLAVGCALVDSYMLTLAKLYDKSDKAKTIPNLIEKCKKNSYLFPSNNDALKNKLIEFQKEMNEDEIISHAIITLRAKRDSILVHNDKKYFGVNLENDTSYFKQYHIDGLVKFTEAVLNYLILELPSEEMFTPKYEGDLCNLFEK